MAVLSLSRDFVLKEKSLYIFADMISFIKRILQKVLYKIEYEEKKKNIGEHVILGEGSHLLGNFSLDFRIGHEERPYVVIGEKCILGLNCIFETPSGKITIGNNVHITSATCLCRSSIEIGDDVTMAWGIMLYDHNSHSIEWEHRKHDNAQCYADYMKYNGNNIVSKDWTYVVSKPIVIESKVWIGYGVSILKGVRIGEGAVVGAGSMVTKDVAPWTVVAGNPAVVVKRLK